MFSSRTCIKDDNKFQLHLEKTSEPTSQDDITSIYLSRDRLGSSGQEHVGIESIISHACCPVTAVLLLYHDGCSGTLSLLDMLLNYG